MGALSKLTDEEKRAAVARVRDGETRKEVAADLGTTSVTIGNWIKAFPDVMHAAAGSTAKKRTKAEKPTKRKATKKRREPKVEEPAEDAPLDVYAVIDSWSLPYPLAQIVHGARKLSEEDDFEALERVEAAVAKHREQMEARAA